MHPAILDDSCTTLVLESIDLLDDAVWKLAERHRLEYSNRLAHQLDEDCIHSNSHECVWPSIGVHLEIFGPYTTRSTPG